MRVPDHAFGKSLLLGVALTITSNAWSQEPLVPPPPDDGEFVPPPAAQPPAEAVPPGGFPWGDVPPGLVPDRGYPPGLVPRRFPGPSPVPPVDPRFYPPPVEPGFGAFERPLLLQDYAWMYIDEPQPREIAVNDIITIIVKEQARMTVDSRYNRNRNGTLKAELKEFIRLGEDGTLDNAAANQPTIDGTLSSRLQSTGQVAEKEEIVYRIAATVVDVKPNGTLELSARKSIVSNGDVLEYQLSGTLRSQDVNRDNTALSENVANLEVVRRQRGKVYDSTKRAWGVKLYDLIFPF